MPESRSYFPVRGRLDGTEWFFVWYSNECDGVLLSSPTRLARFEDMADLRRHASSLGLELQPEPPPLYDFDRLAEWVAGAGHEVDCSFLIDAWNMLGDVAFSLGAELETPFDTRAVYEKLFRGCNLPAITPPGEHFRPTWIRYEIVVLKTVLSSGLEVLRGAVNPGI